MFQLSCGSLTAEETPVPSATPASSTTGAAVVSSAPWPTPTLTPEPPAVRWVGVHDSNGEKRKVNKAYAGRGDEIWVDVINFDHWVKEKKLSPENHQIRDLMLYLNHVPLQGVHPFYWYETDWEIAPSLKTTATTLGFSLVRNEESKSGWSHLLNRPGFNRKMVVSVGFEDAGEVHSQLSPDEAKRTNKRLEELQKKRASTSASDKPALEKIAGQEQAERDRLLDQEFYLTVIPKFSTGTFTGVVHSGR